MILLTLIMAGIIIGGPYAIRSWNAQVKGWEVSVLDSMNDPLIEVPPGLVVIPGCDPQEWQPDPLPGGCGRVSAPPDACTNHVETCEVGFRLYRRTFLGSRECQCKNVPPTPSAKCEPDPCCCSVVSTGFCAAENNALRGGPAVAPCATVGLDTQPLNGPGHPLGEGSCNPSYMKFSVTCGGDGITRYICVRDDGNCTTICREPPAKIIRGDGRNDPAYGDPCPGYESNLPRRGMNYSYVNQGGCSPDPMVKCQIQCAAPFVSFGNNCDCNFAAGWTRTPDGRSCSFCGNGTCEPGETCVTAGRGCAADCGYCSPNCCGWDCPADSSGYVYPGHHLDFVMDFTWGGDRITHPFIPPPRAVANPGDKIAYYSGMHSGDPFHCAFNKTTGLWFGFSSKYGYPNPNGNDPQRLENGQCRGVIDSDGSGWATGDHACRRYGFYGVGFGVRPKRHCYIQNNTWGCFPFCGNTDCDPGENCSNCPGDCACGAAEMCVNNSCTSSCGNVSPSCDTDIGENCNLCPSDCRCTSPQTCKQACGKAGCLWSCRL